MEHPSPLRAFQCLTDHRVHAICSAAADPHISCRPFWHCVALRHVSRLLFSDRLLLAPLCIPCWKHVSRTCRSLAVPCIPIQKLASPHGTHCWSQPAIPKLCRTPNRLGMLETATIVTAVLSPTQRLPKTCSAAFLPPLSGFSHNTGACINSPLTLNKRRQTHRSPTPPASESKQCQCLRILFSKCSAEPCPRVGTP